MSLLTRLTDRARLLARAFLLVRECAPGWTAASLVLVAVQGVLPLASLYLMKLLVDALTVGLRGARAPEASAGVAVLLAAAGGVALLEVLARSAASYVTEAQTQTVTDHLSDLIHAKSVELDLAYFEDPRYYDMLHRAQEEAGWRPTYLVNSMLQAAQSAISLIALAGLLLSLNWVVAAVLVAASAPSALLRLRFARRLYGWHRERTAMERSAWYLHSLLTEGQYAKEVRLLDLAPMLTARFRDLRARLRGERLRIARGRSAADSLAQGGATLAAYGTYGFLAFRALQGRITLGGFVMYYQAFQRGQTWLRDILAHMASLYEDSLFLADLFDFLDLQPRITAAVTAPSSASPLPSSSVTAPSSASPLPPSSVTAPSSVFPLPPSVSFDRVSYTYPGSDRKAVDDVSLTIRPGEHVALVGENGSGKTTLVKLLCRLYDPTAGTIAIDGADLRQCDPVAVRQGIAVMFQDYARYQLTARENIGLGDVAGLDDKERIALAAAWAGADSVVERLPAGYETRLGKWFEDGVELSTGDWQRVALARAFMRNAGLVVLDEPTSALDARVEHEVFQRLRHLARNRTALLISHRLSTVRTADCIYVLSHGRIVERGTHDELVALGGQYATLFSLQAERYR